MRLKKEKAERMHLLAIAIVKCRLQTEFGSVDACRDVARVIAENFSHVTEHVLPLPKRFVPSGTAMGRLVFLKMLGHEAEMSYLLLSLVYAKM